MKVSTTLCAALAVGFASTAALAQQATAPQADQFRPYEAQKPVTDSTNRNGLTNDQNNRQYNNQRESGDKTVPQGLVRASEMMNKEIYNAQDEQVGSVADVVLDTQSGKVKYVALSTGGFLGLGDSLHAVPWDAFEQKMHDGEHRCVLNVSKDQLKNAKGFDEDNWPNMANKQWQQQNDRQYQGQRQGARTSAESRPQPPLGQR